MIEPGFARSILKRLTNVRAGILTEYPFFGALLIHLNFGLANCETAFTDMKRIVFDPEFAMRLDEEQLGFVMLHEVLHCALNHCTRARGYHPHTFNIACDIVVNSNIMSVMGLSEMIIDGHSVMHLAPDGKEGYEYNAEQVYYMLLEDDDFLQGNLSKQSLESLGETTDKSGNGDANKSNNTTYKEGILDTHDVWGNISESTSLKDEWKIRIQEAAHKHAGSMSLPPMIRELIDDLNYRSKLNWKYLLSMFLQNVHKVFEFTYSPPDRKYTEYDIYMQSYTSIRKEKPENIWFCVDTSGSISSKELSVIFSELKQAMEQLPGLSGILSFFDTSVSAPQEFESIEDLENIQPVGGGGTSFKAIFRYLQENMSHELPCGIVILTDGWADYPEEKEALGVPVLWIILNNERDTPWGECVHIDSKHI